jgi:hypothetical protein
VRAKYGNRYEQEAKRDRPGGNPVGPRADPVGDTRTRTPAPSTRGRSGALDEPQALSWTNFAHAATHWGNGGRLPTDRLAALTGAATFDPFAHILDIGPPDTGLGSSWHRTRMLTTLSAANDCSAVGG